MIGIKNADSETPILEIYDIIGEETNEDGSKSGVSGAELASCLKFIENQEGKKGIDIYINSLGGSIVDGLTMDAAIKSCKIPVNTVCVGLAVSMAGVILQSGVKRKMVRQGKLMVHNPNGGDSKELETLKDTLVKMLAPRSGMSEKEMGELMDATTWISAEECLEMKLIDEIVDIRTEANLPQLIKAQASHLKLKNIVNLLNENKMKGLLSLLELDETASEKDAIKEVKNIQNAATVASRKEKEAEDKAQKMAKSRAKMAKALNLKDDCTDDEMEDAINVKNEECENLLNAKNEIEENALTAEAEICVTNAVKEGKIKPEGKSKWVDFYKANKDETIAMIKDLVGSRPAARFNVESSAANPDVAKSANTGKYKETAKPVLSLTEALREKNKDSKYTK